MADAKQQWQDATQRIVAALDIAAEYELLGVRLAGTKPNNKGWIACHAIGREDANPSAGININDGPLRGRYKDFAGNGRAVRLFDFAATLVGRFGGSWKEARNHYARQTGVDLPNGEEELAAEKFEFSDATFGVLNVYATGKAGVTVRGLKETGAIVARWPKGLSAEKTNHLLAVPMHGAALLDLEPTAWHCVASNPLRKIRQYQGKGREERQLKSMTVGDYGLMNDEGLRRLAQAEVVWIVEGISDLFAAQSAIGPWRDEDPAQRRHVVISSGGCSYHPKAEWVQLFAGKDVRIVFDVGDEKDEGQIGAAVWVAAVLPVAKCVRNVKLPLGKDGGKNDLRVWLCTPHTFAELETYSLTFEPLDAGDQTEQLSRHDALLKNLGLSVIGEHEGTQHIELFSEQTRKSGTVKDIDKLSIAKLIQFCGSEVVETYVHDGKEAQPGKYQLKEVKAAIAAGASDKLFHGEEKLGAGVWEVEGKLLLIRSKEAAIFNGSLKMERSHIPFFHGRILDLSEASADWCDFGTVERYYTASQKPEFCRETLDEAEKLFALWFWRHKPAPQVVAGLVICSWLQTVWEWRPEIFITGSSDTGKSLLLEEVISRGMFGGLGMYVQKPTEAAIRQHMQHHARILMVDEFEHDSHRQKILELSRMSSRGGYVIRGTIDQRGTKFRLRHIPWFAAIETGLRRQADRNRYILLELEEIPEDVRGKINLPSQSQLHDLGLRLLAVGLRHYLEARRLAKALRSVQSPEVPGRVVESFAVPCGMISAIRGHDDTLAALWLAETLSAWDFRFQTSRDDLDVLQEILTAEVFMEGGQRQTVSQLLGQPSNPDITKALARVGIRKIYKRGKDHGQVAVLWICTEVVRKNLLKTSSEYVHLAIDQYLGRLYKCKHSKQRLGGKENFRGIEIPFSTLDKHFDTESMDEAEEHDKTELDFK